VANTQTLRKKLKIFLFSGPLPGLSFIQNVPATVVSWGLIGVGMACSFLASFFNLMQCATEAGLQESEQTTVSRYNCVRYSHACLTLDRREEFKFH